MRITKKQIQQRFQEVAREYGEALSEEAALKMGKETFIVLDDNSAYGGYRMERTRIHSRSITNYCLGMHSMGPRYNQKEMYIYLSALLYANDMTIR